MRPRTRTPAPARPVFGRSARGDDDDRLSAPHDVRVEEGIGPHTDVVDGFTVGASVVPNVPSGCQQADLVVGQAFVVAVLVFRDKRIDCYRLAGEGEGSGFGGASAGAGKRQRAVAGQHALDNRRQQRGLPAPVRRQRQIGGAGVSPCQGPFGATVADDDQLHRGSPPSRPDGPKVILMTRLVGRARCTSCIGAGTRRRQGRRSLRSSHRMDSHCCRGSGDPQGRWGCAEDRALARTR
jgi:hypothetical protein